MEGTAPTRCRVLVVDDDAGICALLQATISLDERFDLVAAAHTAAEAIELGEHDSQVDAVLLDLTLPDRDGIDLLVDLRRLLPHARFALFTGWSDDVDKMARAREMGADAVFAKDLPPARLLDELALLCVAHAAEHDVSTA